jgi:hypothetical protein
MVRPFGNIVLFFASCAMIFFSFYCIWHTFPEWSSPPTSDKLHLLCSPHWTIWSCLGQSGERSKPLCRSSHHVVTGLYSVNLLSCPWLHYHHSRAALHPPQALNKRTPLSAGSPPTSQAEARRHCLPRTPRWRWIPGPCSKTALAVRLPRQEAMGPAGSLLTTPTSKRAVGSRVRSGWDGQSWPTLGL